METTGTHQAGLEANPPQGTSRDSECHGSTDETARASLQPLEEHQRQVTALRQALIEGENSGEANDLDIGKIKAKARQRPGS
jgi:antitoxin ParD1/3/4